MVANFNNYQKKNIKNIKASVVDVLVRKRFKRGLKFILFRFV